MSENDKQEQTATDSDENGHVRDAKEQSLADRTQGDATDSPLTAEQGLDRMSEGMQIRGRTVDVEQIPAGEVPDGYPDDVGQDDVLLLTLEVEGIADKTVTTYVGWPGEEADEHLETLFDLHDIPLGELGKLHGEELLLEVKAGHFVPVLPTEEPRGDARAYWGIIAGVFPSLLIFVGGMMQAGNTLFTQSFIVVWLLATVVVLPLSVYLDALDLRTTTNWGGSPLFWAFLSILPAMNVVTVAGYLIVRQNAEPF
ncbi:hypothetical protein ACFQJ7_00370 [Halovenus rubra]|uniref:Uncharacterized protein n=2 Tax=Halovenus rubra TaxID=869890 RepID=A0ACC7E4J8_9EURY|nr:hypothetical protein [Halovenus rubra]